jgi:hypothetical protein
MNAEQSNIKPNPESYFLTPELAGQAVEYSLKDIQKLVQDGTFAKPDMFVALAIPIEDPNKERNFNILAEKSLGDVDNWEYPYDEFAINKINIAARTGMSVSRVLDGYPHLIQKGDVIYPGALIYRGIIAGCSSIEDGEKDEIISKILLENCFNLLDKSIKTKIVDLGKAGLHYF